MLGAVFLAGVATAPGPRFPQSCAVIEAAYTAAIESRQRARPVEVQASDRPMQLANYVQRYIVLLPLRPGEFDALKLRESLYPTRQYRPLCVWQGAATPAIIDGTGMTPSFSNPVFSKNSRLALVEISFRGTGIAGLGKLCVVRRRGRGWSAQCRMSWVS